MIGLIKNTLRPAKNWVEDMADRRKFAPLYNPDANNLDLDQHLTEAIQWTVRAQDAGADRGVAYGVNFGQDWEVSYPETTGYICRTFVDLYRYTGKQEYLDRAVAMGEWEAAIQMAEGAVMGGKFNHNPTPAVFNTGMVLLGWAPLIRVTGGQRFKDAATRAGEWLVRIQEANGDWRKGNSKFAKEESTVYNVKAAWGLCDAGDALGRQDFVDAAVRNAEFCLTQQRPNGWFANCCLDDPERPLLHTIAYAMQGLLEIGKLTGRQDFIAAARKTADAEIAILQPNGLLPGRQKGTFEAGADWCCLTGSAQTSIVLSEFYKLTGDEKYRRAAHQINLYLMSCHDIRNPDLRLRGGVPGSWPVWGEYGKYQILNWATKYLIDALALEKYGHQR